MRGIILKAKVFIKKKLGLCNAKECNEKVIGEIKTEFINDKSVLWEVGMEDISSLASALSSVGI